jgi:hypothetical protein
MRTYDVDITEVSKRTVSIKANSAEEAHFLIEKGWKEGAYILDSDDFKEVDFNATRQRSRDIGTSR